VTAPANLPFSPTTYAPPPPQPVFTASMAGTAMRDVPYCLVDGVPLLMDVYLPAAAAAAGRLPVVVYIHGGRLMTGDKVNVVGPNAPIRGQVYSARGYVFASLNYRLAPAARLPDMVEDVKCAIRHLRARAAAYDINPDRIGIIGSSSGGYLVAMLGVTDASAGLEGQGAFDGVSSRVQAVVPEYPHVTYLEPPFSPAEQGSNDNALPAGATRELLVAMTPLTYVTPDDPPFAFFHGQADPLLTPARSEAMHKQLVAARVNSSFTLVRNAGHGWNDDAARLSGYSGPINPRRDQIEAQQLAFFDEHLK
jgi:acetyl esterase/lipase